MTWQSAVPTEKVKFINKDEHVSNEGASCMSAMSALKVEVCYSLQCSMAAVTEEEVGTHKLPQLVKARIRYVLRLLSVRLFAKFCITK